MYTAHFEALRAFFRMGDYPPELRIVEGIIPRAVHSQFLGEVPATWEEIYGPKLGADLLLPQPFEAAAVEDQRSCVVLWGISPEPGPGIANFGYINIQKYDSAGYSLLLIGDGPAFDAMRSEIATWQHAARMDWGYVFNYAHNPANGPRGSRCGLVPLGSYVIDPDLGRHTDAHRNGPALNDICGPSFPDWKPLPNVADPFFDSRYTSEILANVSHGLAEYAVLARN